MWLMAGARITSNSPHNAMGRNAMESTKPSAVRAIPHSAAIPGEAKLIESTSNPSSAFNAMVMTMTMIAKSAGADYQAVMRAMKQNYPRAKNFPGPGFSAGPCLFKDTMQLAAYARNQFGLGHAAMQVNEGFVLQLVDDLRRSYDVSKMTVGLLGMTEPHRPRHCHHRHAGR